MEISLENLYVYIGAERVKKEEKLRNSKFNVY